MIDHAVEPTRWAIVVIHGIGDTEPGRSLDALTEGLKAAGTGFDATDRSEEIRLPDPSGYAETFPIRERRGRMRDVDVVLAETYWADLSRFRQGRLATALGLFRVILNLHHPVDVGTSASMIPAARLVRALLRGASWLLRGPIAALNLFLLMTFVIGIELPWHLTVSSGRPASWAVASSVLALVVGCAAWWRTRKTDATWSILGMSLAAIAVISILVVATKGLGVSRVAELTLGGIGVAWFAWIVLIDLALIVVAGDWMLGHPAKPAPLATAVSLAVVQSGLWAVALTLLAYPVVQRARDITAASSDSDVWENASVQLDHVYRMLTVQLGLWAIVLAAAIAIFGYRWWLTRFRRESHVPRLIVSPVVTAAILAAHLIAVIVLALSSFKVIWTDRLGDRAWAAITVFDSVVIALLFGMMAGVLRNCLHIAMDIINHLHRDVLPSAWASAPTTPSDDFPRRRGVEGRFRAVLERIAAEERPTHLTIVGHSQGTVIAADVLAAPPPALEGIEVSLLTMGSPLTHLYERYFSSLYPSSRPYPRVSRWLNVYRPDDYIGTEVRSESPHRPENRPLAVGAIDGHVNYWRELAVARILAELAPMQG